MIKREKLIFLLSRPLSTTTESHRKVTIETENEPGGKYPLAYHLCSSGLILITDKYKIR